MGLNVSPELESVRRRAQIAVRDASLEDLSHAPAGKWNSLQILEHLVLSYTATTKGLLRALDSGEHETKPRSLGHRLRSFYVLGVGCFPSGVEAPKNTVPETGIGDDPLRRFNDALVAMDAMLCDAEKRFGRKTLLLNHPALGPLTAQQWRRFHQVHGRHHLRQISARLKRAS